MNGYTIRPASPADTPAILAAFGHAFPSRRSAAEWDRLYQGCPDGATGVLCLAADGSVAAFCGASRHRLSDGRLAAQTRDAFSHPAHRAALSGRGGLFARTAQTLFENCGPQAGVAFHYGFPSPRHLRLGQALLGYQAGGPWSRLHYDCTRLLPAAAASGRLHAAGGFDGEFDRLAAARATSGVLAIVHDARFLAWRFPRQRADYRIWGFRPWRDEQLAGYAAFAVQGRRALLVDFHFPAVPRDARSFWQLLVEQLRWLEVTEIETWCSTHHPDRGWLGACGFSPLPPPEHTAFCYRLYPEGPGLAELDTRFSFTMADCDLF